MQNIKLTIAYDGTNYNGWQIQENGPSIQGEIEKAINRVFGYDCRIHGSGRTDAGVHAKKQVAHFKIPHDIKSSKIRTALNSVLPEDISIISSETVDNSFHARYGAKSKHYRYYLYNSRTNDPFRTRYVWRVSYDLDIPLMVREAGAVLGEHDFKSFQAKDKRDRSSVRRIYNISVRKKGKLITLDMEANGFLYNMVRNITGTLVDIARGYLPRGSMGSIIEQKKRSSAGPTAPPQGLFLMEVKY